MKKTSLQDVFFAFAIFVFLSLFITGGSRLIAMPEPEEQEYKTTIRIEASLICPPQRVGESFAACRQEEETSVSDAAYCYEYQEGFRRPLATDANGNIVMCGSYMHAVYQAFALGDGFV